MKTKQSSSLVLEQVEGATQGKVNFEIIEELWEGASLREYYTY